jgi:monoamine oxidase
MAELLAKAIDSHALDQQASKDELATLRAFIGRFGSLDATGTHVPDGAAGYSVEPGAYAQAPVPLPALAFSDLFPNQAIGLPYAFEHIPDMQATMLQPVGGMDRIAHAIYDQVKATVRLGTPVSAIRRSGERVRIEHGPGAQATEADYCICTLPLTVLSRIPADFSAPKKAALATPPPYLHSVKLAFEAPRFWETDDYIYGGLAWTDRLNENVLYPSDRYGADKGVLVASYCAGWTHRENPDAFSALSHEERTRICRESIEALHPGRSHLLTKPATVAWGLTPYSEGVGALWPDSRREGGGARTDAYYELLKPEGPIAFAGEHLSYQGLWQEGAALSAHEALKLVAAMAKAKAA